jgi:hypothetical protein
LVQSIDWEVNEVKKAFHVAAAVMIGGSLAACATDAQQPVRPTVEEGVIAAETVTLTARVEAVNHATRQVTLRGPEGRVVKAKVDPAVRNFSKVRVGDTVAVQYKEAIALEIVRGGGAPAASAELVGARAAPGERPAGLLAERIRVSAQVRSIDTAKNRIEIQEPNGQVQSLPVQRPGVLRDLKVGDDIQLVYTQALAVVVEAAKKK